MNKTKNESNAVLKSVVSERLKLNPNQWTGGESAKVTGALLSIVKNKEDKPIVLDEGDLDVIECICKPNHDAHMRVVERIAEKHGGKLDADTRKEIERVINPTKFKKELVAAGVIRESGSEDLKDLLG